MSMIFKKTSLFTDICQAGAKLGEAIIDPEIYLTKKHNDNRLLAAVQKVVPIKIDKKKHILNSKNYLYSLINRISHTALPIFYYYNKLIAAVVDSFRVFLCSTRSIVAVAKNKKGDVKKNVSQLGMSVSSLAVTAFAHPVKMVMAIVYELFTNGNELILSLKKFQYKKIFGCAYKVVLNSLFLSLVAVHSIKISMLALFMQVSEALYKGTDEFSNKKFVEGFVFVLHCLCKSKDLHFNIKGSNHSSTKEIFLSRVFKHSPRTQIA